LHIDIILLTCAQFETIVVLIYSFMSKIQPCLVVSLVALSAISGANANRAKQDLIPFVQPDGTTIMIRQIGDERCHYMLSETGDLLLPTDDGGYVYADKNATDKQAVIDKYVAQVFSSSRYSKVPKRSVNVMRGPGLMNDGNPYPTKGNQKALVILAEFQDKKFTVDNPVDYFTRMLNQEGFSDNGASQSAKDWFVYNSGGQFIPEFDVYGPVTLQNKMSYYGANMANGEDIRPEKMIIECCQALDDNVDFSQYDCSNDGCIDNVFVFYAGYGEADSSIKNTIWPHSYYVTLLEDTKHTFDGKLLDRYACTNEIDYKYQRTCGIGTFVHEFSHVMGLPDLYATNNASSFTPDSWSVLDYGPYNDEGRTPPNYSAYELYALDWKTPIPFTNSGTYSINTGDAYIVPADVENEYFLFENRQQVGNDYFLPGHGMLVWHIDYDANIFNENEVNNTVNHQYVDLIEADNRKTEGTRDGDSFPGVSKVTEYSFTSRPRFVTWSGADPGFSFSDITEKDGVITLNVTNKNAESNAVSDMFADNAKISVHNGTIVVANVRETVVIYDLSGRVIASGNSGEYSVAPGVYIVNVAGKSAKVLVK
jgi:M6 family metalloprotease-like protein